LPCSSRDIATALASGAKVAYLATLTYVQQFHLDSSECQQPNRFDNLWPTGIHLKIFNDCGSWVGLVLLDRDWVKTHIDVHGRHELDFVLLSQAVSAWPTSMEAFDINIYVKENWCLLNVMLVEWFGEYAERIGVGVVHKEAWKQKTPTQKLVKFV
jgi:hypothetical protein